MILKDFKINYCFKIGISDVKRSIVMKAPLKIQARYNAKLILKKKHSGKRIWIYKIIKL